MPGMNTDTFGASVGGLLTSGLTPLRVVWFEFVEYLPQLLGAAIALIIGIFVASVIGRLTTRLVRATGVDRMVRDSGLNERFQMTAASNYAILSGMVGSIVKWLIILATIGVAADILNMPQVNAFLGQIFGYIPNVIVAVIILTVGVLASQYAASFVYSVRTSLLGENRDLAASVVRYGIITFAALAALTQLRIVPNLIEILFAGLVLALALAFGLGGRDVAGEALRAARRQAQGSTF